MEQKLKATAETTANENDTAKVQKLWELAKPALRLYLDGLDTQAQGIFNTSAAALDCPVVYIMGAAFTAIAQAAGNRFSWTNGQYTDYPQFYTALVGDSTTNKTGAINKMFKPLELSDRAAYDKYEQATETMKREDKARTPYKMGVLSDYTLEAYLDALKFNPDGVTARCDEILTFFGNNSRYKSDSQDEKFFLTYYGSYPDYKKTRRVTGPELIKEPKPRCIGGIQPKVIGTYFQGRNASMLDDGLLPRFLWFCQDDFVHDEKGFAATVDTTETDNQWARIVHNVATRKDPVAVVFDTKAAELYQEFKNKHARAKNQKTLSGYEAAVCGKLEIHAIMWAMAVRIIRYGISPNIYDRVLKITEAEMAYTLRCMEYFRQTAMRVYDIINTNTGTKSMSKGEWVRQGYKNGFIGNSGRGWQQQLAELMGIDRQKISDFLSGRR